MRKHLSYLAPLLGAAAAAAIAFAPIAAADDSGTPGCGPRDLACAAQDVDFNGLDLTGPPLNERQGDRGPQHGVRGPTVEEGLRGPQHGVRGTTVEEGLRGPQNEPQGPTGSLTQPGQ